MTAERKVMGFSISVKVLEELDRQRGDYSRSRYAERLLKKGLNGDSHAGN